MKVIVNFTHLYFWWKQVHVLKCVTNVIAVTINTSIWVPEAGETIFPYRDIVDAFILGLHVLFHDSSLVQITVTFILFFSIAILLFK